MIYGEGAAKRALVQHCEGGGMRRRAIHDETGRWGSDKRTEVGVRRLGGGRSQRKIAKLIHENTDDPARNRDKRLHDELKQERTRERARAR